ncbi:MAG: 50S ribosomal protein L37ae [Candidatus Methanomethylicia archaeon]|nr:50S ribosomal protein L37ae [Candidatus Methanomethylicia archaeon]MCX8169036.1 50S ribosomal protein L37ae [Candidatus Methanomethylicia archaeon]MDW7988768.1 50S ribosomal protein L37ae [Nitrososphaerota archaeon]
MAPKNKVGPTGRFGARYGATIRARVRDIELLMRSDHKCPRCLSIGKVKRISVGIWTCKKCGYTFTGGAYAPSSAMMK